MNERSDRATISHNVYFGGAVQSLGFSLNGRKLTVGVLSPGRYRFTTTTRERVVVTTGAVEVCLADSSWRRVVAGKEYVVSPNSAFEVRAERPASYICYFGEEWLT